MLDRKKRFFVFLLLAAFLFLFSYFLGRHFVPFVIGGVLSLFIEPFVQRLERHLKLPRKAASFLMLTVVVVLLGGLALTIPAVVTNEIYRLSRNLPLLVDELQKQIGFLAGCYHLFTLRLPPFLFEWWEQQVPRLGQLLSSEMFAVSRSLVGFAISLPGKLIVLIFAFLASYFLSIGFPAYCQQIYRALPEPWRGVASHTVRNVLKALGGFLKAQLILIGIVGLVVFAGLLFTGAPYALTVALVAAPCSVLPLVGTGLVLIPWAVWELAAGNVLLATELAGLTVLAGVVRHLLEPKVLGDEVGLSPLAILVIIYAGFSIMGLKGVLLGLILGVTYKAVMRDADAPDDLE